MTCLCWVVFSFVLICLITNVFSQECSYDFECEEGKVCCKVHQLDEGFCLESTDLTHVYCRQRCKDDSDCPYGKTCSTRLSDGKSFCWETTDTTDATDATDATDTTDATDAYQPEPFTSPEVDLPTIPDVKPVTYELDGPYYDTNDADTESSGSGTLYLLLVFAVIAKFLLCFGCWRVKYARYFQQRRMVTLIVAQTEQTEARQNTASPRATCDNEMQPGNAYSNAAAVDAGDVTPPLPFDAPPPYNSSTFEQSKNVNEEPANAVEMQTGSSTPNPRRWAPFKEEEVSLLPTIAGTQPEGAEEFKQH